MKLKITVLILTLFVGCASLPKSQPGPCPSPSPVASATPTPTPTPTPSATPSPMPIPPSRAQVLGVKVTFQGLTVNTKQFGAVPWFEPWIASLNAEDRKAVYAAKKARGDTHIIVGFRKAGIIYNESPFQRFTSPDYESNARLFLSLIEEFITQGFTPIIAFDGDNGDSPIDGFPNALRQLPILVSLLKTSGLGDLNKFVLYARLWDGVFYGSDPIYIKAFGRAFRALLPHGYLAIEHNSGHIPVGGGPDDYAPGGRMEDYDAIFSEFNGWDADELEGDDVWQIAGRLLGPDYKRPADQPAGDDPSPPWYLRGGSPRGPYFAIAFEYDVYRWVRSRVTAVQIENERSYLRSIGYKYGDL